jgi:hypothetical protein
MVPLVVIPERRFVALILPDPGRRVLRFLFRYQGHFHAVCWMTVGGDGSFYLNPRRVPPRPLIHGQGTADGIGGYAELMWDEQDSDDVSHRKVSHHASGRIKAGANMSTSVNLREIERSTLIRQDEYAHPSHFEVIEPELMKQTDIIVPGFDGGPYELDDEHPLTSRAFAAPLQAGNAQVPIIDDDPNARLGQTAIVVPATNLKGCQDLTFQIQFFNRSGEWPDISMAAILRVDRE